MILFNSKKNYSFLSLHDKIVHLHSLYKTDYKMTKKRKKNNKGRSELTIKILAVFKKQPYTILNYKQLAASLGIGKGKDRDIVQSALHQMVQQDLLFEKGRGRYVLNPSVFEEDLSSEMTGIIDINHTGKGYVLVEDDGDDVFISHNNLGQALDRDTVRVRLFPRRKNHKPEGKVLEVISRKRKQYVGILQKGHKMSFFIPDDKKIHVDFMISKENLKDAKNGDKIIVHISDWPKRSRNPFAKVVNVLGRPGDNDVEIQSILANFDFPLQFPKNVEKEAERIPIEISKEEIKKRRDFRKIWTITIDPFDAKDFDDAISLKKLENGNLELGVHIADVSHYVKLASIIDKEALDRATSIYMVDRVIPMLPEKLSNNVCSLRPNEDKLCYSVVFEIDTDAKVHKYWLGHTIINSDKRYDYEQVQKIIESKKGEFASKILSLNKLAGILRSERSKNGSINFKSTEVRFKLDKEGKPLEIYLKEQKESNMLVEEFMLLANKTVAAHIGKTKRGKDAKTFVYRIHDEPNPEKLATFSEFLNKLGYRLNITSQGNISKSMNKLFTDVSGKAEESMIETIAVRTMAKAVYSTENIGHYGLAFQYYSHFTSPIRRYPDLIVHRLLDLYAMNKPSVSVPEYEELCKHCSDMEKRAAEAERESVKYKKMEYMADKIGQELPGVISGVSKWGLFVELDCSKAEGLARLEDMKDDFYYLDEENYMVIGHRNKTSYRLGDKVTVLVKKIDIARKQMDLQIV